MKAFEPIIRALHTLIVFAQLHDLKLAERVHEICRIESSALGFLLRHGAYLYLGSLWISEWGTAWIWELLVPVLACLGLAVGRAGRTWGVDALLARRNPSSLWW